MYLMYVLNNIFNNITLICNNVLNMLWVQELYKDINILVRFVQVRAVFLITVWNGIGPVQFRVL